jgi:hypothetical protein
MCPLLFWFFLKCVDHHVPTYFGEFLYAKGMLIVKTCECKNIFFLPPRYRVHGALKNAKAENIFMIFFNAGIGK